LLLAGAAALFLLKGKGKPATGTGSGNGTDSDADVGGGAADGSGGGGSGSGSGGYVSPPNISGDPEGYNTELYGDPHPVRMGLAYLGYDIALNTEPVGSQSSPNAAALQFQKDYNKGAGDGLQMTQGPLSGQPITGHLKEDGWPGDDTLNALELAVGGFHTGSWRVIFGH